MTCVDSCRCLAPPLLPPFITHHMCWYRRRRQMYHRAVRPLSPAFWNSCLEVDSFQGTQRFLDVVDGTRTIVTKNVSCRPAHSGGFWPCLSDIRTQAGGTGEWAEWHVVCVTVRVPSGFFCGLQLTLFNKRHSQSADPASSSLQLQQQGFSTLHWNIVIVEYNVINFKKKCILIQIL